jgi:hypothetical protein
VSTPSPALQAMLTQFVNEPGVTTDASTNLLTTVNGSPVLIDQLNAAIAAGHLQKFALLPPNISAGGTYDGNNKVMNLPLASMASDSNGNFSSGKLADLTFVVGHEVQHGFNHQAKNQAYIDFNNDAKQIAQSPALQHDYTTPIATLINANRTDEAKAEIAGWNTLVSGIQQTNPNPSLTDIYIANPGRMRDFIDIQPANAAGNIAYALKPGFTLNLDQSMTETPANVAAIGQSYFDKAPPLSHLGHHGNSDYINYYGAYAVGRVSVLETSLAQPNAQNVMPTIMINMSQLRFSEQLLEQNGVNLGPNANQNSIRAYYDTSQSPPSLHHFNHSAVTHAYVPVAMQEPNNRQPEQTEHLKHSDQSNQGQRTEVPIASRGPDEKEIVGLTTGLRLGNDFREKGHPGNARYERMLDEVQRMETTNGMTYGPNTPLIAAALTVKAEQNKFFTAEIVRMEPDGQLSALKLNPFGPSPKVSVDPKEVIAQGQSFEKSTEQWSQARSRHYAGDAPAAERTLEQVKALGQLSPSDQAMHEKIRENVPSHINDDVVTKAMLHAKREGVSNVDQMDNVAMAGDGITVKGRTPGMRSTTDVNEPAAPMAETVKQTEGFNQQLAIDQRLQQEQALSKKQEQENQGNTQQMAGGMAMRGVG